MKHKTVLLNETIALLKVKKDGTYVDLTLGGGGHSLKILESLESGKLYVFDLDKSSIDNFNNELANKGIDDSKVEIINDNFRNLSNHIQEKVDGIIADLGWSSDQLENIEGLSYEVEENSLDMRFDQNLGVKASDLLNALNKKELSQMFKNFADIYGKHNDQLVDEIIKQRESRLFEKVTDLKIVIDRVFNHERNKNSYYSKIFQALRIAVNQELLNLQEMLESGYEKLKKNGRFLVITFHSGETKIVQNFFNQKVQNKEAKYLTKKLGEVFLTPSVEELRNNINSRSAKLLGIIKET